MPEFHCVMTIQSIWNRQPSAAVTHTAVIAGETAAELYAKMSTETMQAWGRQNSGTSMGVPVVLHWSFTPNAL